MEFLLDSSVLGSLQPLKLFSVSELLLFKSSPQVEGPQLLKYGFNDAIAKVGMTKFLSDLFWVGMFYHLYNQVLNYLSNFAY